MYLQRRLALSQQPARPHGPGGRRQVEPPLADPELLRQQRQPLIILARPDLLVDLAEDRLGFADGDPVRVQ